MKVKYGLQLLLPTVRYGNITLFADAEVDTETDLGRIDQAAEKFGIKGNATDNLVVEEVVRKLVVENLQKMKEEINKLDAGVYKIPGAVVE